jgi:hypothetical protein
VSSFIGAPSGVALGQWNAADDKRLMMDDYQLHNTNVWVSIEDVWALFGGGYDNEYWPGGVGMDASGGEWQKAVWWGRPEFSSGAVSRWAFTGVTRDGYGSALGGMTVKLFKTVGGGSPDLKDVKIDETTSDTSGNFTVYSSYYPDTHYIVTFKSGTPNIQGVTANTLIGA